MERHLLTAYRHQLQSGVVQKDAAQMQVIEALQALQLEIERLHVRGLRSVLFPKKSIKGLYIHGNVGRGKTMVMDLFFRTLQVPRKRRVHFHAFMLEVHALLKEIRNQKLQDPLLEVARQMVPKHSVLCLDEFHVTDIADAMLLKRLLECLFAHQVVLVTTSNIPPQLLYRDGLKRDNFLPCIELIQHHMQVLALEAKKDYRIGRNAAIEKKYYTPLDQGAEHFLTESFALLTHSAEPTPQILTINGRHLLLQKTYNDIAWTDFKTLCVEARAASDYITLASEYKILLLADIPTFTDADRNEIKRFMHLIDILYEHRTKLICTAAASPAALYTQGMFTEAFSRTVSRLEEMQSLMYWKV